MMDIDLTKVQLLKYPEDAATLRLLSLEEKICWYSGQDPKMMIYLGNSPRFKRFWFWSYMVPLRCKRMFYKILNPCKHMLYKIYSYV